MVHISERHQGFWVRLWGDSELPSFPRANMMEHSPPFPSLLWGCLGQLGGVACLMILKALFSHDYTESVMGESFSRPSISDYSPGHRGYDRMSPSRCWLSEARRRVWPSKARSCRVCASELDSWWDAFALGFILQQQANRLMPLRRWPLWAGTFSHRRWKGSTGPCVFQFWQWLTAWAGPSPQEVCA